MEGPPPPPLARSLARSLVRFRLGSEFYTLLLTAHYFNQMTGRTSQPPSDPLL